MSDLVRSPDSEDARQKRDLLQRIEDRVLWLATAIVHHANRVRPNTSGIKVGGHQASSASMTSIMTALWFDFLEADDRVSVKPHAAPVLHAINYLLGNLDREYLGTLRSFGGLQSYPSRTKDPGQVDYSGGSEGLGATAPIWGAITRRYVSDHFDTPARGRQIALVGDGELDEGACWEAIADPMVSRLDEVLWIVDLNRQSLDRVVPDIAANRLIAMFEASGWHCETVKYGRKLKALFELDGGPELERRINEMTNEEYQRLLRSPVDELRERLPGQGPDKPRISRLLREIDDTELSASIRDLGGHDFEELARAYRAADAVPDRPSVVFAYTIKGRSLPTEGHPLNHSALLNDSQYVWLAEKLGADIEDPWSAFPEDSPEALLCAETAQRLERPEVRPVDPVPVPSDLSRSHSETVSTQKEFGRLLPDLARESESVAARLVTASPDVASSTGLGGWINKAGIWSVRDRLDWFADDPDAILHWNESGEGQHIELGIAETNLVGLLGELGASWRTYGQALLPIGTVYDAFVGRALEPWSFSLYAGGQFILVGTPSGVTLSPEGGAHQSVSTPSIGIEQPGCTAWEPAFAQDLEWTFLHALGQLGRPGGSSSYFRLSTRPVEQCLAEIPNEPAERERRRQQVLAGGYRIRNSAERGLDPEVTLAGMGAVMPEVLRAADLLESEGGIGADVVCITSADLLFRAYRASRGLNPGDYAILDELFPAENPRPIVSVLDGHPHALAFLGAVRGSQITCLGVDDFGQSGTVEDLYEHFGIDVETIIGASLDLIERYKR